MRNKKSIAIALLCIALVFMGIGYSIFNATLNISVTAQASGTFNVKITNVEVDSQNTTSGSTNTMAAVGENYAVTETTLSATFNAPGDYITYDITVSNLGTIDAVISVETEPQESTSGSFKMSCNAVHGKRINASSQQKFKCRISFDEDHELTSITGIQSASMTITVNAVQESTSNIPAPVYNPTFVVDSNGIITGYNGNDTVIEIPSSYVSSITIGKPTFGLDKCIEIVGNTGADSATVTSFCNQKKGEYESGTMSSSDRATMESAGIFIYEYEEGERVTITGIGSNAFVAKGITNVDFSKAPSLRTIGDNAFASNRISSLTIPSYITSIGREAFHDSQLTSLDLTHATSLETIGEDAFKGNQLSLLDLTHATSLETIGKNAFFENNLTGTLTIPSSVTSIGDSAFGKNYDSTTGIYTLQTININMTESEWNANVKYKDYNGNEVQSITWYGGTPTITYKSE